MDEGAWPLKVTDYVMRFAPFGVFGAVAGAITTNGLGMLVIFASGASFAQCWRCWLRWTSCYLLPRCPLCRCGLQARWFSIAQQLQALLMNS
ncbi:MAG: hypothetical protein U1E47_00545 [Rivihabitans pingtungensis]